MFTRIATIALGLFLLSQNSFAGQPPAVLWSSNIGARLFAIDDQTNSYANNGGTVYVLNQSGATIQTSTICPRPGLAQRDASGNYYFAGVMPSHRNNSLTWVDFDPQDFGGITVSNQALFLVKYAPNGALIWVSTLGPGNNVVRGEILSAPPGIAVTDLNLDNAGNISIGYSYYQFTTSHSSYLDRFDSDGNSVWSVSVPQKGGIGTSRGTVRAGAISSTNIVVAEFSYVSGNPWYVKLSFIDNAGNASTFSQFQSPDSNLGGATTNARPVRTDQGFIYNVENDALVKRDASGSQIWAQASTGWTVSGDLYQGVHVSGQNGFLTRYDSEGNVAWSTNLGSACAAMILDPNGNRFVSLANGSIARLAQENVQAPLIITDPASLTTFVGSNIVLSAAATGYSPLKYSWFFQNTFLTNTPDGNLPLPNLSVAQSGQYFLVVTNIAGAATSAPATLRVKSVQLYNGNQLLTNGTYSYLSSPTLRVRSAFSSGSSFYTLDGSNPSFDSTPYVGPFSVTNSATVRAIGYSSDFLQSEEADAVNIVLPVQYTLSATTAGGGTIGLNPPGGTYTNGTIVTLTANPSSGWSFMEWQGAASGNNPITTVTINTNKSASAVFGTTVSNTTPANGTIVRNPTQSLYPYGSVVRFTAVPNSGYHFSAWGNAASGNLNPLYFTVTNPTPVISSVFGINSGQSALTVIISGNGTVGVNPSGNFFSTAQTVTLTASPANGESFVNWSGDATGTNNPLSLSMAQDRVVVANFTGGSFRLSIAEPGDGLQPDGFHFTLISDPYIGYDIYSSSNLTSWNLIGSGTNQTGQVQVTAPANGNIRFFKGLKK